MPSKRKKPIKNLTDTLKECHISSESATTSGTVSTDNIDEELYSKWPKLKHNVPDIFLHKPVDFGEHVHKLLSMGLKFHKPYLNRNYTKITCPTLQNHRALIQYFEKNQLPYHTFGNPNKRKMKVVIRGIPKDVDLNRLKSELKSNSIPIVRVHKMHRRENTKDTRALILAVVPYNDDGKKILKCKQIMGHEVKMEPPNPKIKQCHRCQMWGHTQRYCHGQVKCVKCAGEHISTKCERDPDKEPPKCANCKGEHTANYRNCPSCPDSLEHIKSQLLKRHTTTVVFRNTDLVTLENCDTLYRNIIYKSNKKVKDFLRF